MQATILAVRLLSQSEIDYYFFASIMKRSVPCGCLRRVSGWRNLVHARMPGLQESTEGRGVIRFP